MQLSLLDMEQHELLLIAVAHKFMQLKTHNKRINHRRSFVGHTLNGSCSTCGTLLSVLEIYFGYFSSTYNSCTLIVVNAEHRRTSKPQSHQACDQVTTYLRPKNGPIVERTYDWWHRSYDRWQRLWVIARGKSVATRS